MSCACSYICNLFGEQVSRLYGLVYPMSQIDNLISNEVHIYTIVGLLEISAYKLAVSYSWEKDGKEV